MQGALKLYLALTDEAFESGYRAGYAAYGSGSSPYYPGAQSLSAESVSTSYGLPGYTIAVYAGSTIARREFNAGLLFGYNEASDTYTDAGNVNTRVDGVTAYRKGYNDYFLSGSNSSYSYGTPDYDLWNLGNADATSDSNNDLGDSNIANMYTGNGTGWAGVDVLSVLGDPGAYSMSSLAAFLNAINVKTVNLPNSPAAVGSAMTLTTGERTTLTGVIWNALLSGMATAGSIGLKFANWVLGTDNKVILSANAHTGATIPTVTNVTNAITLGTADENALNSASSNAAAAATAAATAATQAGTAAAQATAAAATGLAVRAKTDNLPAQPASRGDVQLTVLKDNL